jgi:oligosaccharide translocation protein RFT1
MLNQALVRLASPSAFGAAAIQFELILSTILFLSREGVRNALLRAKSREDADAAIRRLNLSFLPIVLGIPISCLTSVLYLNFAGQEIKRQPHFQGAITLYALAAMMELLSEPMYNLFVSRLCSQLPVIN